MEETGRIYSTPYEEGMDSWLRNTLRNRGYTIVQSDKKSMSVGSFRQTTESLERIEKDGKPAGEIRLKLDGRGDLFEVRIFNNGPTGEELHKLIAGFNVIDVVPDSRREVK